MTFPYQLNPAKLDYLRAHQVQVIDANVEGSP